MIIRNRLLGYVQPGRTEMIAEKVEAAFDLGVGRIVPSPPTQPFISAVQHVVGGDLCETCHTKEMMPGIGNDKNVAVKSPRFLCGASVRNWPIAAKPSVRFRRATDDA